MSASSEIQRTDKRPYVLSAAAAVLMTVGLDRMGRLPWCKYGDIRVFVSEAWNSPHTSQHLFDPYTFTHVLHGVMFFWLASLIFREAASGWRFFVAVVAEAGWEVFENSTHVIEKYRANTISLDYFGDSITNSIGDVIACAVGFCVASKLGWWKSLVFFVVVELFLLIWIRDSLLLNVVMLTCPLESIRDWQLSA